MNRTEAKTILRHLAKYGRLAYSDHSREQMLKRNVSTEDILFVLMWGKIESLKKDKSRQNFKCEIKGKDLDGENLTVVAAIEDDSETVVITVF
jgi:hypothetical protein